MQSVVARNATAPRVCTLVLFIARAVKVHTIVKTPAGGEPGDEVLACEVFDSMYFVQYFF